MKLLSFLQEKRGQGYSVIAVEQSSSSVPLQNFEFPKKSVLLLGSEQEGNFIWSYFSSSENNFIRYPSNLFNIR